MKSWNPQYKTLDHWRGIAVLWVMLFHGFGTTYEKPLHPVAEFLRSAAAPGWLGVHIFFVISGYCIAANIYRLVSMQRGFYYFIRDRALRILPTYWLAFFITIALNLVSCSFNKTHFWQNFPPDLQAWVGNLFLIQPYLNTPFYVVVYWSLVVEIGFYLFTSFLLIVCTKGHPKIAVFLGLVLAFTSVFITPIPRITFIANWSEFVCGILVFNALFAKHQGKVYRCNLSLSLIIILGILSIWVLQEFHFNTLWFSAIFALTLYLIHPMDSTIASTNQLQWLRFIGLISYSLYLLHVPFQGRVINLGLRFIPDDSLLILPLQILGWGVAILGSCIFYRLVEKPLEDWRHSQKKPLTPVS